MTPGSHLCGQGRRSAICIDGSAGNKAAHLAGICADLLNKSAIINCYGTGIGYFGSNAGFCSSSGAICGTGYDSYNYGGSDDMKNLINCHFTETHLYKAWTKDPSTQSTSTDCEDWTNYQKAGLTGLYYHEDIGTIKTADFITTLRGDGRTFVADSKNINGGLPVLRWQNGADTATVTEVNSTGAFVDEYCEGLQLQRCCGGLCAWRHGGKLCELRYG